MEHLTTANPGTLLYLAILVLAVCWGLSLIVRAFRGKPDACGCACEDYDLAEMTEDIAHIQGTINGMRLAAQPTVTE